MRKEIFGYKNPSELSWILSMRYRLFYLFCVINSLAFRAAITPD